MKDPHWTTKIGTIITDGQTWWATIDGIARSFPESGNAASWLRANGITIIKEIWLTPKR